MVCEMASSNPRPGSFLTFGIVPSKKSIRPKGMLRDLFRVNGTKLGISTNDRARIRASHLTHTQAYLNPFANGRGAELKRQLVRGAIAGSEALCEEISGVRLVSPEPVIHIVGDPARPEDVRRAENTDRPCSRRGTCSAVERSRS